MQHYQLISIQCLTEKQKLEICGFSKSVSPLLAGSYFDQHFLHYDEAIISRKDGVLNAIQFINTFHLGKSRYIYLGSTFSRNAAFFPLFMSWLSDQCMKFPESNIYLLAEFQNPELFLFYKSVFYKYSYPGLIDTQIPESARITSELFSKNIPHIHGLNTKNLSSHSSRTLYTYKKKNETLLRWLEERGIFPGRGDNQVLLVNLEYSSRPEIMKSLNATGYSMSTLYCGMKKVLSQIEANA